ncbi:hypothetical protein GN958_ATG02498 [Phytophthora infestans]|uniref:Uncharacterized protein n=1 Tax=Phytophthora infestans TaxID=4787 RepID=A0A8S9V638_PHYIN|nr:hypothetical protein GN958_ATG02498 [Phytophthora infestans]
MLLPSAKPLTGLELTECHSTQSAFQDGFRPNLAAFQNDRLVFVPSWNGYDGVMSSLYYLRTDQELTKSEKRKDVTNRLH